MDAVGLDDAPPVRVPPGATVRALVVLLVRAAGSAPSAVLTVRAAGDGDTLRLAVEGAGEPGALTLPTLAGLRRRERGG